MTSSELTADSKQGHDTHHFSGGTFHHTPESYIPDEVYGVAERSLPLACVDVVLRDPATDKIFLASRKVEPQMGPWLIGGRLVFGKGVLDNASLKIRQDVGLELDASRFEQITAFSTDFPIAGPGREDHGRHTLNAVANADLKPEEIEELNRRIQNGEISPEYANGAWYSPHEIVQADSDFPNLIKQLVRDLHENKVKKAAIHDEALNEDRFRTAYGSDKDREEEEKKRIAELAGYGFTPEEAEDIDSEGHRNSAYSVVWARTATEQLPGEQLRDLLTHLASNEEIGDWQICRTLMDKGIMKPDFISDNGPALRNILRAAAKAVQYDEQYGGEIFANLQILPSLLEREKREY